MLDFNSYLAGGTGAYAYQQVRSMPSLMAGLGMGLLYGCSGYLIANRQFLEGYQLSFLTSLILAGLMAPKAYRTRAPVPMSMAGVGIVGALDMGWRWYSNRSLAAL
jgi:uncharacterized membrane protein (UPF0136 family)